MPSGSEDWSTARALSRADFTTRQELRFWERVDKSGECWLWTGPLNHGGYGFLAIGTKAKPRQLLAHRAAHALAVGPVPDRAYVLHSCDVRNCVRPIHLSLGTHEENQRQKHERGRAHKTDGEANPRAVLCVLAVLAMRNEYANLRRGEKTPYRLRMAQQYGVTERAIEAAIGGESWVLRDGVGVVKAALS